MELLGFASTLAESLDDEVCLDVVQAFMTSTTKGPGCTSILVYASEDEIGGCSGSDHIPEANISQVSCYYLLGL